MRERGSVASAYVGKRIESWLAQSLGLSEAVPVHVFRPAGRPGNGARSSAG
jgi:hypothetical protein